MKIAINTRFLLPDKLEGIGRYTFEVARRLVEKHPEHEYLFLFDRPYEDRYLFSSRVRALVLPPPARHPLLWYLWFEWSVPYVLRKYRADVFFSPDGYASLRSAVPTLMTVHDLAFEHFSAHIPKLVRAYYRYFTPRYCEHAAHLLAVSGYTAADIVQQYGISRDKVTICGNAARGGFEPLDEAEKEAVRRQYSAGNPYFLYTGAIHPRKNVHRLIEAFTAFKAGASRPAQLLIAGRMAWQAGPVRRAYEASSVKGDIHFLGFVPDQELRRLLGAALAFVYPSLFEGFGLPILEAMEAEVPVITAQAASMPEVAGEAALLVPPTDVEALARALARVDADPRLRATLVEKGRIQRQRFSWDKTADIVYRSLLKCVGD